MAAFLAPIGNGYTFFTSQGVVLSGGQIATYLAGTTTPAATYTDSTSVTPNANPIILGSNGIAPQEIWLTAGIKYKFIILDANSNVLATYDNLSGVNDSSSTISQWVASGFTPTFISSTSFSLPGDATAVFTPYRRIQVIENSGVVYGTILTSVFSGGITAVTVSMDTTALDSGMSIVNVSFLTSQNQSIPANISAWEKIKFVAATVASNALTCTLNPANLDFRSTTLGSGVISSVSMSTSISLVVPFTATLGTVNAIQSRLVLIAINNGGVVELAIVNISGGNNLDETTLISTTAISAAATAANVIYSTTARTNVPFRVIGYIESTQATAGTWATAPSTIQGQGGNALAAMGSLGYGQTWQAVTRALATTYYNTTGRPIVLSVTYSQVAGSTIITVNGNIAAQAGGASGNCFISAIIPPGASYTITQNAGNTISFAYELR